MANDREASDKISKARSVLVLNYPFFGALALRMRMQECNVIVCGNVAQPLDTMATDGKNVLYNPEFVNTITLDNVVAVLAHEALHCAFSHHTRRGDRDAVKWNIAGDYVINLVISKEPKLHLPEGILLDNQYDNMSTEEVYSKLPNQKKGEGNGKGNGQGQGNPFGIGGVVDAKGQDGKTASAADKSIQEQEWKIATVQAAQVAKSMGKLPAGIDRLIEEILNPKIDWRDVFKEFILSTARNDYSWFPPNRRYIHQNLYLPSLRSNEIGDIVIAVDTSCSIGNDELAQFQGELNGILEDFDATVYVVYCDSAIAGVETFTKAEYPVQMHARGGGGTDFRPPFTWVEEQGITPTVFIYLTDMCCSSFPEEPGYPCMWCKIGHWSGDEAPFGVTLEIND